MNIPTHLEGVLTNWKIDSITSWEALQENVFRITLSNGQQYVLKDLGLYDERLIQRLHFERDVLLHVAQAGLAVAVPLHTSTELPYALADQHVYRLSHWLPNQLANLQTRDERLQLYRNYGSALARFHKALASYHDPAILSRTWQTTLEQRVLDEALPVILKHLEQAELPTFIAALARIEQEMKATYAQLPLQLIIWDCHPANVAVDGLEVSGFIDCDHISIAPRIFDVADFLVHLLKWDVGDTEKATSWLEDIPHLIQGYESISVLSKQERRALYYAIIGIPLIFMAFFFEAGERDLTKTELATFRWLVEHRDAVIAQLETSELAME